jgi:superfamily II DNA or RNA helicase
LDGWARVNSKIAAEVESQCKKTLAVYREDDKRVRQDANIESSTSQGGYGRKQLFELVQNGADALRGSKGGIHVILTAECLYVANQGKPLAEDGVGSLMASHLSEKRGDEIGRFGLGFKSVVAISNNPQILSRSGSFGFDRAWAHDQIQQVVPDAKTFPVLRLARPLDPITLARRDPIIEDLMGWATTIVRVPLHSGYDHLTRDIEDFPPEFLLFSPQATEVHLEDRAKGIDRTLRLNTTDDGTLVLDADGKQSSWRVYSQEHRPSAEALKDAGELAHRESIRVWWAAPVKNRTQDGRLWAFFPTDDRTTLSGIVNAPWKLSDDRLRMLEGAFNREILTNVLPALVAKAWPDLLDRHDPAGMLDVLPSRGRGQEARGWADDTLNEPVFAALRKNACLPDSSGALKRPGELKLFPEDLTAEQMELWKSLTPVPSGWVHEGVDTRATGELGNRERRFKAVRLLQENPAGQGSVQEWVETLVDPPSVEASATAILLVDKLAEADSSRLGELRDARIVMLEDGSLTKCVAGRVFVRASKNDNPQYSYIHPALAGLPAVRAALGRLGVTVLDRAGELRALLKGKRPDQLDWSRVWPLIRACASEVALGVVEDELGRPLDNLRVRTRVGRFVGIGMSYLPGTVVSESNPDDAEFCVDRIFHRDDLELLSEVGAVAEPTLRNNPPLEPWLEDYTNQLKRLYIKSASGSKPQMDSIEVEHAPTPWPLQPLEKLSREARVVLTSQVLLRTSGEPVKIFHKTQGAYPNKRAQNAVHHWLANHGRLATPIGPLPPKGALSPSEDELVDELDLEVLPIADLSETDADALGVPTKVADLPENAWRQLVAAAGRWSDPRRTARAYSWAVHFIEAPAQLRAFPSRDDRLVDPRNVAVVTDEETYRALHEQSVPSLLIEDPDDAQLLIERWGLVEGKRLLEREIRPEPAGESQYLVDQFPKLRLYLNPEDFDLSLQPCSAINLAYATPQGQRTRPVPQFRDDRTVYVSATEPEGILHAVSEALELDLDPDEIRRILDEMRAEEVDALVAKVRNSESDDERLALLVGEEALRRAVPAQALASIEARISRLLNEVELAGLVRSVHGVGTLQFFKETLAELGLEPPVQWAGRRAARRFVADLGFPQEYAGFASDQRDAVFAVEGPADLPQLHDYQLTVTAGIKRLVRGDGMSRAMVSLPTGAGKTRVAVQALVEEIRDGELEGPLVWIAQSDELCEQAVETWAYIWRACGPSDTLTIGRLWASNEVDEVTEGSQLVVATIDKLRSIVGRGTDKYEWLQEPSIVVVDEAHTSIGASYTEVLEWMGRGRSRKSHRPLLGLTATPFRGTSKEETERLAARYDRNRLDAGAFSDDPYVELQARHVLARVRHHLLTGVEVKLTKEQAAEIETLRRLPSSVANALAANDERNRRIVDDIKRLPEDHTVLLFATSIDNANVLAAMLAYEDIPAVAISGDTDSRARRYYVDEFKAGRIRVITNHSVFTQGFDAPKVQAVYVTRPTFSPNVYQQMIGRGLRGPLNGGSDEVLIVNIEDTFNQFGELLSFREFEPLWSEDDG